MGGTSTPTTNRSLTNPATGAACAHVREVTFDPSALVDPDAVGDLTRSVREGTQWLPEDGPTTLLLALVPGDVTDDDDADQVMAALGYAWASCCDPSRTGKIDTRAVVWAGDFSAVTVDVDLSARSTRTRTRRDAAADFVATALHVLAHGSPTRKDGTALLAPWPGHAMQVRVLLGW